MPWVSFPDNKFNILILGFNLLFWSMAGRERMKELSCGREKRCRLTGKSWNNNKNIEKINVYDIYVMGQ